MQLDFTATAIKAQSMSIDALHYSIDDASKAAKMADLLEEAKCRVSKTSGYYRDEISVYAAELKKRLKK